MESFSGGFYTTSGQTTVRFTPVSTKKRVCFLYDKTKPAHCSDQGCNSEPLRLSARVTRLPEIRVHVEGWKDPAPSGDESRASHIRLYKLEIHNVLTDHAPLTVEVGCRFESESEYLLSLQGNLSYGAQ